VRVRWKDSSWKRLEEKKHVLAEANRRSRKTRIGRRLAIAHEQMNLPINSLSPVAMNSKGLKSSPRRFSVPHTTPGAPGRCVTSASPASAASAVPCAMAAAHMSTPLGAPLTLGSTDRLRDIAIRHLDLALDMVVSCIVCLAVILRSTNCPKN